MKKWLIRCLTVLAMVCLIPGIVLKAAAETTTVKTVGVRRHVRSSDTENMIRTVIGFM